MTPLQIIYRAPNALTAHGRNARRHSARQINQLKASIRAFGFNAPIVIDPQGQILAGHGRVRAAIELNMTEVPTVTVSHLSDMQARAFMVADNRIGELSTWDELLLADELQELSSAEEPFEITDTGFEMPRIDVLIEERHKPKAEDEGDAPVDPRLVEPVSRFGDLWLLGRHRLFVGNALDPHSYLSLLGAERAQLVFIDPPYNVPFRATSLGLGRCSTTSS